MRMQDISPGAEYAIGVSYQWNVRFRSPLHYTARGRVIEAGLLRDTWNAGSRRDGVKVHFLDPETGEPIDGKVKNPVRIVASRDIRQDWSSFAEEHKKIWQEKIATTARMKANSDSQIAQLQLLLGDLDDGAIPAGLKRQLEDESRSPGQHSHAFEELLTLLAIAYNRGRNDQ